MLRARPVPDYKEVTGLDNSHPYIADLYALLDVFYFLPRDADEDQIKWVKDEMALMLVNDGVFEETIVVTTYNNLEEHIKIVAAGFAHKKEK